MCVCVCVCVCRGGGGGVWRIIQSYFFLFLDENICCDPSSEPSRRDGSNDGLKYVFMEKYG